MTAPPCLRWVLAALCLVPSAAGAQATTSDAAASNRAAVPEDEHLPAYHHSIFSWEHTLTAATLGVGDKPQSYNPTYTMGFAARTRYYLVDDTPRGEHFSLRLDAGLYSELTNNDFTTRRGEWSFSDTSLSGVYARRFHGQSNRDGTLLELRPLSLTLPTSKVSLDSGRYFGAGTLIGVNHITPWRQGKAWPEIVSTVRLAIGYEHEFARAKVPTNASLERVRLTPDGRSLPGDTLSGASLVSDQLDFSVRLRLELGKNVLWTADAAFSPAWKYDVDHDLELCGVVRTGCTDVRIGDDDSRYLARTQFSTEVSVRVARGFSVELGYGNISSQLGADGRRRSFFYSPQAIFYTSLSFFPHELASSSTRLAASPRAPSTL